MLWLKDKKISQFKILFLVLFLGLFLLVSLKRENGLRLGQTPVFFLLKQPGILFGQLGGWLGGKIDFWKSIGHLKEENEKLFEQNLVLKSELAELKEARKENEDLRQELGLRQKEEINGQAALVVASRLENGQARIFIDKGSESGINVGTTVLAGQKFLVGRVKKVFWRGAEVELIFNSTFLAGVEIQDQGVPGVVQGVRGMTIILDKVPKSAEIKKGQALVTSGLGGEFPRGFLVGFVGDELDAEGGLFRRFSVELPLEIEKLRLVWVTK